MRFVILGGTFFIGPAIIEELLAAGHEVVTVTRGLHRGPEVPEAPHHVCDRFDEAALTALLGKLRPAVIVDTCAYKRTAPETSCEAGNRFLDRSVLVATVADPPWAFFTWAGSRAGAS